MLSKKVQVTVVLILVLALGAVLVVPAFAASSSGVFSFTNNHRANNGLSTLKLDGSLSSTAQSWTEHMAKTGVLAHNPNRPGWENVGMSCNSNNKDRGLSNVMNGFVNSSGHNANMLGDHTNTGVGYVYDEKTDCTWVTQLFTKVGSGSSGDSSGSDKSSKPKSAPAKTVDVKDYAAWSTIALNVRSGPGTGYSVVGSLKNGEEVNVEAENSSGSWVRIGKDKWASKHYLSMKAPSVKSEMTKPAEKKEPTQKKQPTHSSESKPDSAKKDRDTKSDVDNKADNARQDAIQAIQDDLARKLESAGPGDYFVIKTLRDGVNMMAYVDSHGDVKYVFIVPRTWMIPQ